MMDILLDIATYMSHTRYMGKLKVLNGVNFRVGVGEKVGLVGETGCGKTTAMKAMLRIRRNWRASPGRDTRPWQRRPGS
jgi:ABC-type glutathione transport system ATPase component